MKKFIFFLLMSVLCTGMISAQRKCGAVAYNKMLTDRDPSILQTREAIEQFTQNFTQHGGSLSGQRSVISIPVVFHIIYNTPAQNVSDAQIQSQLDALNQDYRKLNADWTNTPSVFQGLAADCEIQFCLAQRDPSGNATTGIIRKATSVTSFPCNGDMKYSSRGGDDAWNRDSYLNIWVCPLNSGYLGYAQYPGGPAESDGVVITYWGFGTTGTALAPYNKGRTATHEVGHWLNLTHIWGDDGSACTGTDNVDDTPNQGGENYGWPSFPHISCGDANGDMFMNYMDYTDDACMTMFSAGQKSRMQALFAPGGARSALLNSTAGCQAPVTACGSASGLSAGSITSSSAILSWNAVSGATGYNIQYKTDASSTWTTINSATTSVNVSGLASSTTYSYAVQAICSSGNSIYSLTSSFTTGAAITCSTPSGVNPSTVAQSSATVVWNSCPSASAYNVQYKANSASTWNTLSAGNASININGLNAATAYNCQVQIVCTGGCTNYSAPVTFTTLPAACPDNYEPNNSTTAAVVIPVNTELSGLINTNSDNDYFKFTTTSTTQKYFRITLSNQPADFDIALLKSNGSSAAQAQHSGTANEVIKYNNAAVGTYYVQVYSKAHALNTVSCYTLNVSVGSVAFREAADQEITAADNDLQYNLYPNPSTGDVTLEMNFAEPVAHVDVYVFDMLGKQIRAYNYSDVENTLKTNLDMNSVSNGIYNVLINTPAGIEAKKLIINR